MWRYGGSGTPEIPEFGVCEVASALGMSPKLLDAALHKGVVDAWRVRKVASATRQFTIAQAAEADRRLSAETLGDGTPMLGRVSMARLRPDIAQRRRRAGLSGRVDLGRGRRTPPPTPRPGPSRLRRPGGAPASWLRTLGDERSKDVLRSVAVGYPNEPDSLDLLYDQVTRMRAKTDAEAEGETDTPAETSEDAEPAEAATSENAAPPRPGADGEIPAAFGREPPRRRLPATVVYLHLDRETQTWSMDGVGPISPAEAADIVGHSHVTVKPVIDLAQNLTYTGYVAPPRLKEQTALRNAGYCTFPSCNRAARKADFDHMSAGPRRTYLPGHGRIDDPARPTAPPTNQRGVTAGSIALGGHTHAQVV